MQSTKLVSSFYTNIHGHPFYGHSPDYAREDRYLHSMRVLNNLNTQLVCYCNDNQYDFLTNYINQFNLKNIILKVSNLIEYPMAKRMIELKESTNQFKFYHEVDWNKIYLLEKEYDEQLDYLYWIDIGLSHAGIFPKRFNPNAEKATGFSKDFNTYSFTNVFTPKLFDGINKFLNHNLLSISNELRFHDMDLTNRIFESSLNYRGLSVGGILGGHISKIKWFIDIFNSLANISLDKNTILNHEAIIAFIRESYPDKFETFYFQTWYHEDSINVPDAIKQQVHFCEFFDLIYEKYVG